MDNKNKGKALYDRIQAIKPYGLRRKAIAEMRDKSGADYYAYINYQSNLRKKKYMSDPDNRDKVYKKNREYKAKIRKELANPYIQAYLKRLRDRINTRKLVTSLQSMDINDLAQRAANNRKK